MVLCAGRCASGWRGIAGEGIAGAATTETGATEEARPADLKEWVKEDLFRRLKLDEIPVPMEQGERERLEKIIWNFRSTR